LSADNEKSQRDILQGMLEALDGRGSRKPPAEWSSLYQRAAASSDAALRSLAVRLATIFGDKQAIAELRQTVLDDESAAGERRDSLNVLLNLDGGVTVGLLHQLASKPSDLRRDAIQALVLRNDEKTDDVLLAVYPTLSPIERQDAIGVLGTRRDFARTLLAAIEADKVDRRDVSAFALQQLRSFSDAELKQRIATLWANDTRQLQKSEEIARYKTKMSPEYLQSGSAAAGRLVFEKTCAKCHVLFGEGARVGPDLTGSGRKKADYVLNNLIDPNAEIDPKYRLTKVLTTDGRLYSGFIIQQDDKFVTLRTQEARIKLMLKNVEELQSSNTSMMPEGMLRTYSDEQIRDLLVYLQSEQQVEPVGGGAE
jgi:putative heme-binding domain-containing protein